MELQAQLENGSGLKEFLNLKEISKRYPFSLKFWYKHIDKIPHRKIGKLLIFKPEEVRAFFDSRGA